jgi:hypothetical protein
LIVEETVIEPEYGVEPVVGSLPSLV